MAKKFLERWKTEVEVVMNGEEALEVTIDHDLILMDLQLPFMSGIETTKKIREFNKDIPVIAQTAFSDPELLYKCTKAGCNKYILKPLDINEMYKVLGHYLC